MKESDSLQIISKTFIVENFSYSDIIRIDFNNWFRENRVIEWPDRRGRVLYKKRRG